ncbi:MAG TPA: MBL fold metallo-hydrolase [Chitinophagaceae bacterium]|jgi:L-ascorbate metabolism protein UlaG (beta-lactamase superfamily)
MNLIPAIVKDQGFIAEVEKYQGDKKNFHLWWLGQSGYLLLWKGKRVLIDPYLSDSLTKKYAATNKPHIRMSERVVDPQLLKNISIVSSSHNHTDHLDGETLIPIIKNNPNITFIIPEANRNFVSERVLVAKDFPAGLNDEESIAIEGFTFHGIPAKHNEIERDEEGNCKFMGYVIRFGKWSIYHSGDTLWYDEMIELLKPFEADLALLPINGNDPSRGVAGNLNFEEAARLGKEIQAGMVIPCHYDMFTFNTADPQEFEKEARKIGQPYRILEIGGHFSSNDF